MFPASVIKTGKAKQVESIQLKVNIKIGEVGIRFETIKRPLSNIQVQGMRAGLVLKQSYTQVDCTVSTIKVTDLNVATMHQEVIVNIFNSVKLLYFMDFFINTSISIE